MVFEYENANNGKEIYKTIKIRHIRYIRKQKMRFLYFSYF